MIARTDFLAGLIPRLPAMIAFFLVTLVSLAPEFASAQGRTIRVTPPMIERQAVEEAGWGGGVNHTLAHVWLAKNIENVSFWARMGSPTIPKYRKLPYFLYTALYQN